MITANQVQFLLSAPQAAAGYTKPGSPGNSLGLYVSTSQLSTANNGLDALFTDLTGAQNAADQVDYACLFVYNSNGTNSMLNGVAWLPTGLLGAGNQALFAIAVDTTPPSALAASTAQALSIQSPIQAPGGLTWYAPSPSSSGGHRSPTVPAGDVLALWIRRTANGVAASNQVGIDVTFDSLA